MSGCIDRLCADARVITVLIPRTDGQRNAAIAARATPR